MATQLRSRSNPKSSQHRYRGLAGDTRCRGGIVAHSVMPWEDPGEDLSRLSPMERRALDRMERRLQELLAARAYKREAGS